MRRERRSYEPVISLLGGLPTDAVVCSGFGKSFHHRGAQRRTEVQRFELSLVSSSFVQKTKDLVPFTELFEAHFLCAPLCASVVEDLPCDRSKLKTSAPRESLGKFNARSSRIDEERDLQPDPRHIPEGALEGDAVGRELLAERLEVLHLEADVIE